VAFARVVLAASAFAFLAIGVPALLAPTVVAEAAGMAFSGSFAESDFRAVYGGLECACAAALLASCTVSSSVRSGLVLQQLLFGGLIAGRGIGWLAAGSPGPLGILLLALEALGLVAGTVAYRRLPVAPDEGVASRARAEVAADR